MNMPKLSPGHLLLEKLTGSWVGEEIMYPSQWDPKGGVAIGRNNHELSLGGFALLADYEQERDGAITFTGHGVYTYDPKEGRYSLHWFEYSSEDSTAMYSHSPTAGQECMHA